MPVCVSALRYVGHADLMKDLDNFTGALAGVNVVGAYLPANTPGTIEHWMLNEYYRATRPSYSPSPMRCMKNTRPSSTPVSCCRSTIRIYPTAGTALPDITLPEYRKYATMRVDALNHALKGIPREKVRLHVCWGSHRGPHHDDIPLKDIIDLIFRVNAGSFSIEASNPCHEHEWRLFEEVKARP
jgi:5-methyltetrahydropteroyltriglutamate--homocysteine methyltransferase